ncbi:phosphoadenosine phosphosulfate reductase [Vibrio phage vB_VpP_BT-1011]|uniref:Phosphoadenosine phosphosulfate reductase n=1 Tax=Vibrio phage vB_VpP_BT-1011 TaxID=2799672 RepID=A0A8F2XXE0_9CAUD|nr:phosphoadenosine phosphosulfate reductase [Vibrio phage vB_VpP_BT-1011]QWX10245.1 hypothetical protein vBVpPBT1011_0046 [Vibrio phage vB_VpP_BT-1011]
MRMTTDEAIKAWGNLNIVCGMGDDSTKMIAAYYLAGYEPNAIIFCDTGNEMPHTYKFMAFLSKWMMERNWSKLIVVKKRNSKGEVINVYDDNYKNGRMPPVLYGFKSCSEKFKTEVSNRALAFEYSHYTKEVYGYCDEEFLAYRDEINKACGTTFPISFLYEKFCSDMKIKYHWKGWDKKIVKAVGINADEMSRADKWTSDECFETIYPLIDWDIGADDAEDLVEKAGLYLPGKSSCFMCPNMTAEEIVFLHDNYPLMYYKALAMEDNVVERGNDTANVDRVFVTGNGIDVQIPSKMVKKDGRKIDLQKTLDAMSAETKLKLGLEKSDDQFDLFGVPATKLEVRNVKEPTNFIGLARSKSWREVVAYYQMTGQMDLTVGGQMCANGACGL